jgi:hypothetical protein
MATTTTIDGVTRVNLDNLTESVLWSEQSKTAAAWRVSIKRPARVAADEAGARAAVVLDVDGTFLEDLRRYFRGCDEHTMERAEAWLGSVPWHAREQDVSRT